MISKSPEQQMHYDARLKFQLDEAARLEFARDEGIREGEAKGRDEGFREGEAKGVQRGVILGRIVLLQELLGLSQPASDELSSYDEGRLSEIADQLQSQLRNRKQ